MAMQSYGTNVVLDLVNVRGGFPTRNWQSGVFEFAEEISGQALTDKVLTREVACFACPIACGRGTEIKKGKYAGHKGEGPEYETVGTFGGMCYVSDMEAITMAGYLCNEYGLDTISAGSTERLGQRDRQADCGKINRTGSGRYYSGYMGLSEEVAF